MKVAIKILDKILANWTKPYLKGLSVVTWWNLSQGHKIGSKHKAITIIYEMKRMKEIISIDAEKHLTKPNSLLWWSSVRSFTQSCLTLCEPWTAAYQTSLSITNFWSLLKFMSIKSVMPSNHLILCCPFLLLPSIFPSIRVFSKESVLHIRWPKYWSFSFSISPSDEYSGLISFRNWLDLLAVQGTLKSLLQHHGWKSINSLALSFLYGPTLTSIHDYWINYSFD